VTLASAGSGASSLSTGAIDRDPTGGASPARPLAPVAAEVLRALGVFVAPDEGVLLATTAGLLRPARGHDAALLDWTKLRGKRVGVVRALRPGWNAAALARAWQGQHDVDVVALEGTVLRHSDERVIPDADFAARHDAEPRLVWLGERLREALAQSPGVSALVLPPSLGVDRPRAAALSLLVGIPCGEALGSPGGPSGLRFERARDRALEAAGVRRVAARASAVERTGSGWRVTVEEGADLEADVVAIATGGLLGGGIEYGPAEWVTTGQAPGELPRSASAPFRFTVACDALRLGASGRTLDHPGSLFGLPPEKLAWPYAPDPVMDRVGAMADAQGRVEEGLFVAGELMADVPHGWLSALEGGAIAGAAAAACFIAPSLAAASPTPP
jgi:glycerol-3-phosphate dehydrogenase subunit B